jgi:uncharacterized protein with NRDE domain
MRALENGTYAPFNLYVADGERSYVTCQREGHLETEALEPGVHVLCNRDLDDRSVPKVARLRDALAGLDLAASPEWLMGGLARILASHDSAPPGEPEGSPLESTCIHTESYGTRSSAVLFLGTDRWRFWYADGAPCTAKYRNLTTLLDDLRHSQASRGEP